MSALTLGPPGTSFRYVQTYGVTETPYFSDTVHLNGPEGLFMDASSNLYVVESWGDRVLRYDSTGHNTLVIGKAGVDYPDDYVLQRPTDVALDSAGNIWVADQTRVVQYTPGGVILQSLPARDNNPEQGGSDHGRFDTVRGLAFDSADHLFVSDSYNHRVEVFDISSGVPVYSSTIGVTGVYSSTDGYFNYPYRLAVDSANRVYVVDNGNNRVQRCAYGSGSWTCTTFASGLNFPLGITIDSSNTVFIADNNNGRVRKCAPDGTCSDLVTNPYWPYDVAVDTSGNVYISDHFMTIVAKYDSAGQYVSTPFGVLGVPYLTDSYHYNQPHVAIDSSNNIILVEQNGQRLIKLDPNGVWQWTVGTPGVLGEDNTHFNWPYEVAVDKDSNIYVADSWRVQIFSPAGAYQATLGTGSGAGNYEFNWASGIAVDSTGTIYVADCPNNRVQVYNSSRTYVATLGETGVEGSDNSHFICPMGVGVDAARNVYVADAGNNRVQKFNSSRVWQMTLGTPGPWGSGSDDFAYFGSGPEDIAVDAQGRIYVDDIWNNRVQVFDSSGAYLTTIGGAWGANSSQFRHPTDVDVDSWGNVYVADSSNHRVQKFALGVPGWLQKNINGFGVRYNRGVDALEVFSGTLYAGTQNPDDGASVWQLSDGITWQQVSQSGFGNAYTQTNGAIADMIVFSDQLYASTSWGYSGGGQIWRSPDGTSWEQVLENGFGSDEIMPSAMAVYSNTLYVGTGSGSLGFQIWRSDTGNELSWTNVVTDGHGNPDNRYVTGLTVFDGALFAAVEGLTSPATGMQIWQTTDGTSWTQVNTNGFGSTDNYQTGGFAIFDGYLYVGTRNDVTGGQVWRWRNGSDWDQVVADGFGDINNFKVESLYSFGGSLYAGTDNGVTGVEIWRSSDGITWTQVNPDGFGDSNNGTTLWSSATTNFRGSLYFGTVNWNGSGGELWQMLHAIYLPSVRR